MSINGGKALKFKNEDSIGRYSSSEWANEDSATNVVLISFTE